MSSIGVLFLLILCVALIVAISRLKHGGADARDNMQWQTVEAAKMKDRWE